MSVDPFNEALTHIKNSDFVAHRECTVAKVNKLLLEALKILKEENYISDFSVKEKVGNKKELNVRLNGMLTNMMAIKPRSPVHYWDLEKFEKRYLPAKSVGILILSTPKGLKTNIEAKQEKLGGRLIAFVY